MGTTEIVTIEAEGRDAGKVFRVSPMSIAQTTRWVLAVVAALSRGGLELQEGNDLAIRLLKAIVRAPDKEVMRLANELFSSIRFIPDPGNPTRSRPVTDDDMEEVATRLILRRAAIMLSLDLSYPSRRRALQQAGQELFPKGGRRH